LKTIPVETDVAADDARVAAEDSLPEAVAEHGIRVGPFRLVVGGVEESPRGRRHTENVEVVAAHHGHGDEL
jgi:hypothetical protein